jgi:hypothetical protein
MIPGAGEGAAEGSAEFVGAWASRAGDPIRIRSAAAMWVRRNTVGRVPDCGGG